MSEITVGLIELAGFVYGDGYIDKSGRINAHHSIIQEEYALYKKAILIDFGFKVNTSVQNTITGFSTNKGIKISTTSTSFGKNLRKMWYVDSKKSIPSDLLCEFGWEQWAFVYQDDGRRNKIGHYNTIKNGVRKRVDIDPYTNRYEICLGYPSDEEIGSLMESLSNLNVESSILIRKDGQRNISISRANSKTIFYENIKPLLHKSMLYKMDVKPTATYTS